MAKESQVFLKPTMLGGFKKKEVLSYIFELNEVNLNEQQKLTQQVETITKERDSLADSLADREAKLKSVQDELSGAADKLAGHAAKDLEHDNKMKDLNDELERLRQTVKQKDEDIARYMSVNSDLENENKELTGKIRALSEKSGSLEQATAKVNDMIGNAKNDAARIVEQAKASSAKIMAGANMQAENIIENAKARAKRHIYETNVRMDGVYKQFDGFVSEIANFKQTMNDKMEALHKATLSAKSKVPESAFAASVLSDEKAQPQPPVKDDENSMQMGVKKDDSGFFRLAAEE